jgi:aryl-phospho-beta-D-glucosidase BglC (GH1 family)
MANTADEAFPFVEDSWKFVESALKWGQEYGIGVLIDFHAAPGSQNGALHNWVFAETRRPLTLQDAEEDKLWASKSQRPPRKASTCPPPVLWG